MTGSIALVRVGGRISDGERYEVSEHDRFNVLRQEPPHDLGDQLPQVRSRGGEQ